MLGKPYRVTLVHPCVGRRPGMRKYMRSWQMEAIPAATIAALLPQDVECVFYDDRLESIPYDEPTDLVAISVETYTAKRAYQIATEFRQRRIPVVMGGFHATLCPDEVQQYCESLVVGEAEEALPRLIDDYRHGQPARCYKSSERPDIRQVRPKRSIFQGKKYLPIRLIEFSRGCRFKCDFCAIQSFFSSTHRHRSIDRVIEEIQATRQHTRLFFFIDDNLTSSLDEAKALMRALIPLKIRWVSQSAINVAFDEEALELMVRSGCQGILIGLESLAPEALKSMNKSFNLMRGGPTEALANLRRWNLRVYGTFVFGYDTETPETFRNALDFAIDHGLFIAAFNHITPFPGTPLYTRLKEEQRLLYDPWWLDHNYRYGMIPFQPKRFTARELEEKCYETRRKFYAWTSILKRGMHRVHWSDSGMWLNYWLINAMHHWDIETRNGLPLGDAAFVGDLLKAEDAQNVSLSV